MRSPETLIELSEKLHVPRERYLKWKQISDRYDRGKHTVFAKCFMNSSGATVRERELQAYNSAEYANYLEEWDKAEKEKVKAQIEFENIQNDFEAIQSALAYDRDALKKLI